MLSLLDFDKRAGKVLRMQEEHGLTVRPDLGNAIAEHPRAFPDQTIARRNDVRHIVADVMNAAVRITLQEFGNRGSFSQRLNEFDLGVGQSDKDGDDAVLGQRHCGRYLGAKCRAIDFGGLLGIPNRNRHVIQPA